MIAIKTMSEKFFRESEKILTSINIFVRMKMRSGMFLLAIFFIFTGCSGSKKENWVSIFNGQNLDGWDIKITGFELNENFGNTFIVEDGLLKVNYDEYEEFGNRFGHIFFNQPYSHYKLRLEYRFVGNQVEGGPGWAFRNNGIMFHSQSAESMELNQNFPVSIEAQFLGGGGQGERATGSVCTPGTDVEINGERILAHCTDSKGPTFHGDQWIRFELVAYGDSLVHHIVEGDTIFTYGSLRVTDSGLPLGEGYIALQAESHPTHFRNIEILDLNGTK